jgi:hypothetical protein
MTKQPEALRLADELDAYHTRSCHKAAAAELRHLVAVNKALLEALKLIENTDPVDAALDPQRAMRVARAAIAFAKEQV